MSEKEERCLRRQQRRVELETKKKEKKDDEKKKMNKTATPEKSARNDPTTESAKEIRASGIIF